jgi:hypothetical protein
MLVMEFCDSDRSWLALGLADAPDQTTRRSFAWSSDTLTRLAEADVEGVAIINPRMRHSFAASAGLLAEFDFRISTVVALVHAGTAPALQTRRDDAVFAFLCSIGVFRSLLELVPDCPLPLLCYSLFSGIMNGRLITDRVFVRQLPHQQPAYASNGHTQPAAVIMAHRGRREHLDTALRYIHCAAGEPPRVRVGLDVSLAGEFTGTACKYPLTEFYYTDPAPVGPYAIRQELATRSGEPLLILHDSDDISCHDRFTSLHTEMRLTGCDLVGSHELCVDELRRDVVTVRYPLDVSNALRISPGHSFLHATAMMSRSGFFSVGGLSTDRIIAYDTQFLLRAYFKLRIRNVDAFLYIRRRHAESLTVAPLTADGIPLRLRLAEMWKEDFEAIKRGRLALEHSSLKPVARRSDYRFIPFKPALPAAAAKGSA